MRRQIGDGVLGKTVQVNAWFSTPRYRITTDASPWGLGAWLAWDEQPVAWFACEVTDVDAQVLKIQKGSCSAQAVLEALAVLVALRTWFSSWRLQRAVLVVRSDSQAALGALGKLASPAPGVNAIAREVAIDLATSRYGVSIWEHLPGVQNEWADALSRLHQPEAPAQVPQALARIKASEVDVRGFDWWEARVPPVRLTASRSSTSCTLAG